MWLLRTTSCVIPADVTTAVPLHRLRIEQVFQGDEVWKERRVEVCSFSTYATGDILLVLGVGEGQQVDWGLVAALKQTCGRKYVEEVMGRLETKQTMVAAVARTEHSSTICSKETQFLARVPVRRSTEGTNPVIVKHSDLRDVAKDANKSY